MRKIFSLLLAVLMCFSLSITVFAETQELIFPMTTTTGTIIFKGVAGFDCNIEPDVAAADSIILKETGEMPKLYSVKLVISGDKGNSYVNSAEYIFDNYYDRSCTEVSYGGGGMYWKLNVRKGVAFIGDFLADSYSHIYSIKIVTEGMITATDEKEYNSWITNSVAEGWAFDIVKDFDYAGYVTDTISNIAMSINKFEYTTKNVCYDYPILYNTDINSDGTISRNEVYCLSRSVLGAGEGINGFEGLVSQVSQFFNKKDNGTITFHVTSAPATYSSLWVTGGIASTQTGLLGNVCSENTLIGLFFNYDTTGSLVSTATIDTDGNLVFNIDDVLTAIGGYSLGTINNIYYGLLGGITYTGEPFKGLKIDRVTLRSDDNEKETEIIIEPEYTDDEDEAIIIIEESDDEDDEPVIILDEEEFDAETDIVPVEEKATEEDENDAVLIIEADAVVIDDPDPNPRTGVSLGIIPLIALGSAAFLMRKRK